MREHFHQQLNELDKNLINMVKLCETSVLLDDKLEKLKKVINIRDQIDNEADDTEDICMKMLVRQQPLARDMNTIAYSLKLIRDMQRIGTQAVDLAIIAKDISPEEMKCSNLIRIMTKDTISMLKDTVKAYLKKDKVLATDVTNRDDNLDNNYLKLKKELSTQIFSNPDETSSAIDILMVAKYLERIGDHTVNISKWIIEIS